MAALDAVADAAAQKEGAFEAEVRHGGGKYLIIQPRTQPSIQPHKKIRRDEVTRQRKCAEKHRRGRGGPAIPRLASAATHTAAGLPCGQRLRRGRG
jgi:hypothetical protein